MLTKILYWTPRIVCLLYIGFISLFALDVFSGEHNLAQTLVASPCISPTDADSFARHCLAAGVGGVWRLMCWLWAGTLRGRLWQIAYHPAAVVRY